ncbi:100_t:CDS:2 [Funneliformis geosporum]|uniref:9207_t:CDS:1 n=1 Tax=Funneliformis geosporum TaxID=1117311 RepID=A0A9W4SI08_9GLOM|nr:100_t:CDS:2 [Funneliformis geosporum]CAI2169247.1 9207_t:CDS:2 [Funneliformis geosporum]
MLRIRNFVIPASNNRKVPGKNNTQLRLSVNCYENFRNDRVNNNNEGINMILSHANGFHKEIWEPIIRSLFNNNRLNINKIFALDCSNHGESATLNETILPDTFQWWDYGHDILQVIDHAQIRKPIVGIGHSLGGTATLIAELIRPGTFSCIVAIDPTLTPAILKFDQSSLTLKRNDSWGNREAAKESFLKRSFFKRWDSEVLDFYVEFGLRDLHNGQVALKCPKLQEYYTFSHDVHGIFKAFDRLHEIECPILFITGENSEINSKEWASLKQSRTQRGEWHEISDCGHLVIMEKPELTISPIESFVHKHLVELKDIPTMPNNPSRIDEYTGFIIPSKL